MAALTTQHPAQAGVALTYAAAAVGGDSFQNNGREMMHIKNGSGSPVTVTFTSGLSSGNKCSFGVAAAAHDKVVTVGATSDALVGPFNKDQFNDATDGLTLHVTYSAVTTVTVAVLATQ